MDFIVGLPRTLAGYDSIWVIVDRLTKVAHFIPVRTNYTGAKLAELYMTRIVCLHGVPKKIVSDRGSQFTSRFWKKLHESLIVYCKVLEIVPYKKLTYSWKGGPGDGQITLDSIVEWTLVAKDNGTELSLDHSGFKEVEGYSSFYPIMDDGWFKIIRKIAELINAAKHGSTVA